MLFQVARSAWPTFEVLCSASRNNGVQPRDPQHAPKMPSTVCRWSSVMRSTNFPEQGRRLHLAGESMSKAEQTASREQSTMAARSRLDGLRVELNRIDRIASRRDELDQAVSALSTSRDEFIRGQIRPLCDIISALYLRAQGNSFITAIGANDHQKAHRWIATAGDCELESFAQLSQGQRQDFALAVFLARARELRGTFFLDEPLLHLDDLSRVGVLDIFRVVLAERNPRPIRLVVTTASNALVRLFREKFSRVAGNSKSSALRIYRLSGDPSGGVVAEEELFGAH